MGDIVVQEIDFANALVRYVSNNPQTQLKKKPEGTIPDHWTLLAFGTQEVPRSLCLASHGLFDATFERHVVIPRMWDSFERGYLSPVMDLLERIYHECQEPSVADWKPDGHQKTDFYVGREFWMRATQKRNYKRILEELSHRNLVVFAPLKIRNMGEIVFRSLSGIDLSGIELEIEDVGQVLLRDGGKLVELPRSYQDLELVIRENSSEKKYERTNIPRFERYGDFTPCMYMVADNCVLDDKMKEKNASEEELWELVKKHTGEDLKKQNIMYVLAEKKGEVITPRYVGHMFAFMLEYAYGSPAGCIKWDHAYTVPSDDLSDDTKQSVDCSHDNWEIHHESFLKQHPKIAEELNSK
ncbi:hypothetical protein HY485_03855 [Candidatus Woesearchaeota archaeon]|nr:hypothetical protein [Candidatus Woesearchaeota archaeon]